MWLPYSEKISLKLKVSFIVLTLILGTICFVLMKNHSGHGHGGHHWFFTYVRLKWKQTKKYEKRTFEVRLKNAFDILWQVFFK